MRDRRPAAGEDILGQNPIDRMSVHAFSILLLRLLP
jgi:hypothetical protein